MSTRSILIQLRVKKTLSASECDNPFFILKMVTNPAINDIIRIGEFFKGGHELKKKIEFDSGKKVFPIIIAVIGALSLIT